MGKGKRPTSEKSADELCIIGAALQHQDQNDGPEWFSASAHLLFRGSQHSCFFPLQEKLKLGQLVGKVLEKAKQDGAFNAYPKQIFLASHETFLLLDFVKDRDAWDRDLVEVKSRPVSIGKPLQVSFTDRNNKSRTVEAWLVDTKLLGAERATLGQMGGWIDSTAAVDVPENGRWGPLQTSPDLQKLALQAASITANFAASVANFSHRLTGEFTLPPTLGSLAEKFVTRRFTETKTDIDQLLGYETLRSSQLGGRPKKFRRLKDSLHLEKTLATECYHGGRNEAFYFGITDRAEWRDDDLRSAYPTVIASLGMPRWDQGFATCNSEDFEGDVIGLARVEFSFPESVRFPVLPVRLSEKLIFPRSGTSYATAAEITLARSLGAEIKIKKGFVVPLDTTADRPFEKLIAELDAIRNSVQATYLDGRLAKIVANSIAGKMGQGLDPKRETPERINPVEPCRITQPFLAAHVTGTARAVVGEILNAFPPQVQVLAVATDGFISNASADDIERAIAGPLCRQMSAARKRISARSERILETKRKARRLFCGRNRVIATLESFPQWREIVSRSGIVTPPEADTIEKQNDWLVEQFFQRTPEKRYWQRSFDSSRRPLEKKIAAQNHKRVGLEYDLDRKPALPVSVNDDKGRQHVSFATEPWPDREDCLAAIDALAEFRKTRCVKTMEDHEDLTELIEAKQSARRNPAVANTNQVDGALKEAKRQFLRALKSGEFGLEGAMDDLTHQQIAKKINEAIQGTPLAGKISVTANDLRNARKRQRAKSVLIPITGRTRAFMELMKSIFPDFERGNLLKVE